MVSEWEQWAVAHRYVAKHGDDAPILLAMRADVLLARGELAGFRTYVAITRKSEQLLQRPEGAVH